MFKFNHLVSNVYYYLNTNWLGSILPKLDGVDQDQNSLEILILQPCSGWPLSVESHHSAPSLKPVLRIGYRTLVDVLEFNHTFSVLGHLHWLPVFKVSILINKTLYDLGHPFPRSSICANRSFQPMLLWVRLKPRRLKKIIRKKLGLFGGGTSLLELASAQAALCNFTWNWVPSSLEGWVMCSLPN